MRQFIILGSTGSIGTQSLQVLSEFPEDFQVYALITYKNISLLQQQIVQYRPRFCGLLANSDLLSLHQWLYTTQQPSQLVMVEELSQLVSDPCVTDVVCALNGIEMLTVILAAVRAGKTIHIATKEMLVVAGQLLMDSVKKYGAKLLPLDSEHVGLHQLLYQQDLEKVRYVRITASGGAFRLLSCEELQYVTCEEALIHPTWKMGKKITIDSATLANKGLEVIEAAVLYDLPVDKIEVLVHPESVIHAIVEYVDGSVTAQLSEPNMCIPIRYAFGFPRRLSASTPSFDLLQWGQLNFFPVDHDKFPMLNIALDALREGQEACIVFNAANTYVVQLFLDKKISFTQMSIIVDNIMQDVTRWSSITSIDDVISFHQDVKDYIAHIYADCFTLIH